MINIEYHIVFLGKEIKEISVSWLIYPSFVLLLIYLKINNRFFLNERYRNLDFIYFMSWSDTIKQEFIITDKVITVQFTYEHVIYYVYKC